MGKELSAPNAERQPEQSKNRDGSDVHFSGAQTEAHDQRHRNRHRNREYAPRTFRQRLHNDEREHGEQNDHDRQHAYERECAHTPADLFLHHLAERFAAATHRSEEHDHVVNRAAKCGPDQNPKCARQKTKLRREHRPDERSRPGDGGEVVTENHPAIRRHEIFAVVLHDGRRRSLIVEQKYLGRQPFAVKTIADRERTESGHDNPERVDWFAARSGDDRQRADTHHRDRKPNQLFPPAHSPRILVEIAVPRQHCNVPRFTYALFGKDAKNCDRSRIQQRRSTPAALAARLAIARETRAAGDHRDDGPRQVPANVRPLGRR